MSETIDVIAPVFINQQLMGFVASRAHHADIGASSPGSMPISSELKSGRFNYCDGYYSK